MPRHAHEGRRQLIDVRRHVQEVPQNNKKACLSDAFLFTKCGKVARYELIVCLCAHIPRERAGDRPPCKNATNLPHVESGCSALSSACKCSDLCRAYTSPLRGFSCSGKFRDRLPQNWAASLHQCPFFPISIAGWRIVRTFLPDGFSSCYSCSLSLSFILLLTPSAPLIIFIIPLMEHRISLSAAQLQCLGASFYIDAVSLAVHKMVQRDAGVPTDPYEDMAG